jgi:cycloeucalenol cycloisomerase
VTYFGVGTFDVRVRVCRGGGEGIKARLVAFHQIYTIMSDLAERVGQQKKQDTSSSSSSFPGFQLWSTNPAKAGGEKFFAVWSAIWIGIVIVVMVTRIFEDFTPTGYMILGIVVGVPPIVYPLLFPLACEKDLPVLSRYTTKANTWIWIMAWVANYFWTHYFYTILGAKYTFEAWRLNNVPFSLYLMSHSYFLLYHTLSNIVLRNTWRFFNNKMSIQSVTVVTLAVFALGYVLAFLEAFTIQNFPYYEQIDQEAMFLVGSVFYCLYFLASFPMFFPMDEYRGTVASQWTWNYTIVNSLACCMIITQLLDFWRLFLGPIFDPSTVPDIPHDIPFVF